MSTLDRDPKFMFLSQPRSRSKWLSEYLSRAGVKCGHDIVLGCSSVDEFVAKLKDFDGTIETGIAAGWKLWTRLFPYCRFATIIRPPMEIADSFKRLDVGTEPDYAFILSQDMFLHQFYKSISTVRRFWFESFYDIEARRSACRIADLIFDEVWDRQMCERNIQVDAKERLELIYANIDKTRSFINDMAYRTLLLRSSTLS